ncbi:MAG: hypothetical protein HYX92_15850 [Chloroflexi bacterium]|nr:hypothetical protein [Chloroflexota bacterium]
MAKETFPMVVVERCLCELSPEETQEAVAGQIDAFIEALTSDRKIAGAAPTRRAEDLIRYEGADFFEAQRSLYDDFLDRGWADGFPIVPPTPQAVEAMLRGTSRSPDEVVVVMDPGRGLATVEKIAINAVMAGCRPEHLPVVIAAVEAVSGQEFNLPMISQSTGPHAPLLVINGPVRHELGINFRGCSLGPGAPSRVNTVIGRALRLIMMNIGGSVPNVMDMDVIGSPNKYSMCLGENEEENPWEPLHVQRGFSPDASTVTAFPCTSLHAVADGTSYSPEDVLNTFAWNANISTSTAWSWMLPKKPGWDRENLLLISPEHARIIANGGWGKPEIRQFMFQNTKIPLKCIKDQVLRPDKETQWKWLATQPDEMMIQTVRESKAFHVIVVGAHGSKSAYMDGMGEPVTREIKR